MDKGKDVLDQSDVNLLLGGREKLHQNCNAVCVCKVVCKLSAHEFNQDWREAFISWKNL